MTKNILTIYVGKHWFQVPFTAFGITRQPEGIYVRLRLTKKEFLRFVAEFVGKAKNGSA